MHTDAFFSIVKSKTIPALIIAALMDQLSCPAVLGNEVMMGIFSLISITSFRTVKNTLLYICSFFGDSCRLNRKNSKNIFLIFISF